MTGTAARITEALADLYTIEDKIGQGGMATVYLAHDPKHDRRVAVKVLRPELGAVLGPERFLNEIKVTANLQHPHILPLFDSGQVYGPDGSGPFLYYVVPLIQGGSLSWARRTEVALVAEPLPDINRHTQEVVIFLLRHWSKKLRG